MGQKQTWQQELVELLILNGYLNLDLDRDLNPNFDCNLDRDLNPNFYRDLDHVLDRNLDCNRDRNLYRKRNRNLYRNLYCNIYRNCNIDRDRGRNLNHFLNPNLDLALNSSFDLDLNRVLYRDFYGVLNRELYHKSKAIEADEASDLLILYFPLLFVIVIYYWLSVVYELISKKIGSSRRVYEAISREYLEHLNEIYPLYVYLVLLDERQAGRMPAWESIRIVRERIEQ